MTDSEKYEAKGGIKDFIKQIEDQPRSEKIRLLNERGTNSSYWKKRLNKAFIAASSSNKPQSDTVLNPIINIITIRLANLLGDLILQESAARERLAARKKEERTLSKFRNEEEERLIKEEREKQRKRQIEIARRARHIQEMKNSVLDPETGRPFISAPVLARQTGDSEVSVARVVIHPPQEEVKSSCWGCRKGGRRKTRRRKTRYNRHNTRRKTKRGRKQRSKTRKGYKSSKKSKTRKRK